MAFGSNTMRGLTRYASRVGHALPRLVVWPQDTTPVDAPIHWRPITQPSGSGTEGDLYWDATANAPKFYNGSAWVTIADLAGATAFTDVTVTDDLSVGDDLNLTSTGAVITIGPAATNPAVLTHSADTLTLASGDTLAITTADKLTVGGVIVPQFLHLSFRLTPHASATEYDLYVAPRAMQVTKIDVVPSTLQGGALTATICKATGTSAPANGTTPMHTANAIDLNTGADTVQNITLTATTADLQLAAGDRIGIDYSAALSTGIAVVTISAKFI